MAHCDEVGCLREQMGIPAGERIEVCRGIHAEQNALVQAAGSGVNVTGAILYCTHEPCVTCTKMLVNAGIREFVVGQRYPDPLGRRTAREAGIRIRRPAAAGGD
jgi:dCMP deaminase